MRSLSPEEKQELFGYFSDNHNILLLESDFEMIELIVFNQKTTSTNNEEPMADINLFPVTSSQIEQLGYDPESKTLRVKFKKSGLYDYQNVSQETFDLFRSNTSPGKFFHTNIKGKYEFAKLA